jgi:lipopolysaccharide transport system ATP-binding protein
MSDVVIRAENLGKRYRLGETVPYRTLRESLCNWTAAPLRWLRHGSRSDNGRAEDTIWALRDVSFEVRQGEVLGVIGRNGAGKSTLLKILTKITKPTTGQARIRGRVGSLLEVGTGFHPELTGRENIFLNGAILGMTRVEIKRKFDEIVDFSGVERFLDTPVKRYSSGMRVRLAFAVAAHLEPEILLIDEVLAVGDADFQNKCLGKMGEVAGCGRTVMFVSHNMTAVTGLCGRCLVLDGGEVLTVADARSGVQRYYSSLSAPGDAASAVPGRFDLASRCNPYDAGELLIRGLQLSDAEGSPRNSFPMGEPLEITIHLSGLHHYRSPVVGIILQSMHGNWLAVFNTGMRPPSTVLGRCSDETLSLRLHRLPLLPGPYHIDVSAAQKGIGRIDYVEKAGQLHVVEADVYGTGYAPRQGEGVFFLDGEWEVREGGCDGSPG